MSAPPTIPAVLCIDVEPDERCPSWPLERWPGFDALLQQVPRLRDRLEQATGRPVGLGWFLRMDPQIELAHGDAGWVAHHHRRDLESLLASGDELGLHPHSWRWVGERWVSDQADPGWVAHCALTSFDAYESAFGHRCRAYRYGDRFRSDDLTRLVVDRGIEVDLTPEPGMPASPGLGPGEATTGVIPATAATARSAHRIGLPGCGDLLVVPLTSAPTLERSDPGQPLAQKTLILWTAPHLFAARLAACLAAPGPHHLAFAIRTDIATNPYAWAMMEANLSHLGRVLGSSMQWMTPSAARAALLAGATTDPTQELRADVVPLYARELERELTTLEAEVTALRAQQEAAAAVTAAEIASLTRRLDELGHELRANAAERARTAAALTTIEGTLTWQAHQRALPVLRRVVAARRAAHRLARRPRTERG